MGPETLRARVVPLLRDRYVWYVVAIVVLAAVFAHAPDIFTSADATGNSGWLANGNLTIFRFLLALPAVLAAWRFGVKAGLLICGVMVPVALSVIPRDPVGTHVWIDLSVVLAAAFISWPVGKQGQVKRLLQETAEHLRRQSSSLMSEIVDRKRSEEALRLKSALLTTQSETSLDGILAVDIEGKILLSNKRFGQMWRIPQGLIDENMNTQIFKHMVSLMEDSESSQGFLTRLADRSDEKKLQEVSLRDGRVLELYSSPLITETGQHLGRIWYFRDISDRKLNEAIIKRARIELEEAQRVSRVGSWTWDTRADMVRWTPEVYRITGRDPNLPAPGFAELRNIYTEESWKRASQAVEQAMTTGEPYDLELEVVRPDGTTRWNRAKGEPLLDEDDNVIGLRGTVQDITEHKIAEDSLRLRAHLLDSAQDAIMAHDIDGKLVYANRTTWRRLGYSEKELMGLNVRQIITPENATEYSSRVDALVGKGESRFESEHLCKDGSTYPVEVHTKVIEMGGRSLLISVARDISNRKRTEAALTTLKMAVEASSEAIFLTDRQGTITYVNPEFSRLYGYTAAEVTGKVTPRILKSGRMQEQDYELFWRTLLDKQVVHGQLVNKTRDGAFVTIESSASPILDSEDHIIGFLGIQHDITERKLAESAIADSEAKFRTLAEQSPNMIFINKNGRVVYANQMSTEIMGYSLDELYSTGFDFRSLVSPQSADAVEQNFKEHLEGREVAPYEYTLVTKEGKTIDCILSSKLINYDGGQAILGTVTDITAGKRMHEHLALQDRLASIGELVSGVAHELNNPLTGVIGFSQLLMEKNVSDEIREDVTIIASEAQRAARIVKNLLTFARQHGPAKQPSQMNRVLEDVLRLREYEQKVNNITVVRNLSPDLPEVMADYFQMQQVFMNIIINAEFFMIQAHQGGTLTVTTENTKQVVRVSITDDGPGIAPDSLKKVFDPFFTTKDVGKGTGLGLSICHGIMAEHGGTISVSSNPGEGATFVVDLPIEGPTSVIPASTEGTPEESVMIGRSGS